MSDVERQFATKLTNRFEEYLNEMFAGLVTFEIDAYFTTQTLSEKDFTQKVSSIQGDTYQFSYDINASQISELTENYLNSYRCIITSIPFGSSENNNLYRNIDFIEQYPQSNVSWERAIGEYLIDENMNALLNQTDSNDTEWQRILAQYIHRFAHIAEYGIPNLAYRFEDVLYYCSGGHSYNLDDVWYAAKIYLLKQFQKQGDKNRYGIPYEYWTETKLIR